VPGRIVIVSGAPGAGKSSIAHRLAVDSAADRAVHLHTDDFYAYIKTGFVEPWRPESQAQNLVVMNAIAGAAATFALGGYEVVVDGVVGPWFFVPWRAAAAGHGLDLRYILLMPDEATVVARGTARKAPGAMTDPAVIRQMWRHLRTAELAPGHILDTTGQSLAETAAQVRAGLSEGRFRLS
jgi:predicted kinase